MSTRVIPLILTLGLIAIGCGDAASDPATTTSTVPSTTTTTAPASTTTSSGPATTTSTVPASTTTTTTLASLPTDRYAVVRATIFPAEPLSTSGGAGGSGCAPGPGALPDGIWYGTVLAADQDSVDLDLACFYFGEVAYEVGDALGVEVNNDYIITNDSPTVRTVPVSGAAVVWSIPGDLSDLVPLSFATDWPPDWQRAYADCPSEWCGMWLYVNEGIATELVEQYVP